MDKKIDINQVIDGAEIQPFHYRLAILAFLLAVLNGYAVVVLAIIVPAIAEDLGVSTAQIAPAHMAIMVGILVGSIVAGIFSDKYGRRWTIIGMTCLTVFFMGLTIFATSLNTLIIYRFLTGIGIGAIAIILTLVSEYIPIKNRNLFVIFVFAGPPFSGVIAGHIGPYLVNQYGWESIFYLGFLLAIPILGWALLDLPESVKYLVAKNKKIQKVHKLVQKVIPNQQNTAYYLAGTLGKKKSPIQELFLDGRAPITFLLWMLFFSTQFVMFFLNLWVPTILVDEGWTLENGGRALANFNLGSFVGGFFIGRLADKIGVGKMLKIIFPISAISLIILGFCITNPLLYFIVAFFAGGATLGANMGLGPFSASLYPTHIRGTGVGTALGIGRIGAMTAALLGGFLISKGFGGTTYYHLAVFAPVLCSLCIYILTRIRKRQIQLTS